MAGNTLRLGLELDDGGVTKKLNGIAGAFDKIGGKGSGAVFFGSLGAKAIASGFNLIGDAVGGVTNFLSGAVSAAIEDQASSERLDTTLKNVTATHKGLTPEIEAYIDAQGRRGFADDAVRDGLGQLAGATGSVEEAQNLLNIAEDLARSKGLDLGTAVDIVTKAHNGNSKALKTLGIDVGKAKTGTELLDAVQKNVKGSADAWNGTMAGKLNKSQIAFNEAVEKIGYTLLPVLSDIMQKFADDWLPALGRGWDKVYPFIKAVADIIGTVIDQIRKVIGWVGDMIGAFGRGIDKIKTFMDSLSKALSIHGSGGSDPVADFLGIHLNSPSSTSGSGLRTPTTTLTAGGHSHDVYLDGQKVGELIDRRSAIKLRRSPSAGLVT